MSGREREREREREKAKDSCIKITDIMAQYGACYYSGCTKWYPISVVVMHECPAQAKALMLTEFLIQLQETKVSE